MPPAPAQNWGHGTWGHSGLGTRRPHSLGRGELCLLARCVVLAKFINFSEPQFLFVNVGGGVQEELQCVNCPADAIYYD